MKKRQFLQSKMRQFISSVQPDKDGLLYVSGKEFRYLRQVLRLKCGDMLSVRLPDGELCSTTVCRIDEGKKSAVLQVCADGGSLEESQNVTRGVKACEIENAFSYVDYYLFQYIAKPVKMEQIIRQAVECGVKYIVPVTGAFSQKACIAAMQGAKNERFERIIREARQQSGSPVETTVLAPVTTEQAAAFWEEQCAGEKDTAAVILWERSENTVPLKTVLEGKKIRKAAVAVGCEGGISAGEVQVLQKGGFVPVHFATNILRCETAALYGIAAVQSMILELAEKSTASPQTAGYADF